MSVMFNFHLPKNQVKTTLNKVMFCWTSLLHVKWCFHTMTLQKLERMGQRLHQAYVPSQDESPTYYVPILILRPTSSNSLILD
jgi:hypothetical protein